MSAYEFAIHKKRLLTRWLSSSASTYRACARSNSESAFGALFRNLSGPVASNDRTSTKLLQGNIAMGKVTGQVTVDGQAPQATSADAGEAGLVRRALARDEVAIRAIMKANNRRLYRLARGILRNDAEAEDVVQETYVRAFTRLEVFRGESSLSTWLSKIAINEALGRLRRARPDVDLADVPEGTLEAQIIQFPLSSAADPEKTMAQREIQK